MSSDLSEIILLSLKVSGTALLFSTLIGVPVGALIGLNRFNGRRIVAALLYTGMGFPPVVIGLFVYLLLSRSGPLGSLNLAFHPHPVYPWGDDRSPDHHRLPAGGRFYHGSGDGR